VGISSSGMYSWRSRIEWRVRTMGPEVRSIGSAPSVRMGISAIELSTFAEIPLATPVAVAYCTLA